ncbi:type II toxin-antitoxin system Phd/YefM family antitoxin [Agrococcus sp. TF02-05]|uniref:type II toxin-antitoxin system Phd/YefM family antitoxin n=1 Tax=Agrococcus sp. TF02-05 TaxID=2815211 RepID=UPI001AA1C62B|nr:prevent-host-death protein [Agrococcus sp. TF02-05]MBO1769080.1 prevent-host-death protein [Agrococcus sp. TF02-05]
MAHVLGCGYNLPMTSATSERRVGIRALRDGLSAQLQRVKRGETIQVTEHGRVIALIIPARHESSIERLVAEGVIELPLDSSRELPARVPARGSVSELVADQRR